jgi:hypothetical protein
MTKKEAVEHHRKMWRWIAEDTVIRKDKVFKSEYLTTTDSNYLLNDCFCCEYVSQFTNDNCIICPIVWPGGSCCGKTGLYTKFVNAKSLKQRAEIARIISELPERETNKFDIVEGN